MRYTHVIIWATALTAAAVCGSGCTPVESATANYTIALYRSNDPQTHVNMANHFQKIAERETGWDIDVIHETNASTVHWGRYATMQQAGTGLQTARARRASNGRPLFPYAMVIPMPGPAPGPPEWDLRNVEDPNAYYTVLVAVEYDVPEEDYFGYKKRIVDYTRELREMGYEAYYHVVGDKGLVCVGTFPQSALRTVEQKVRHPRTGDISFREVKVVRNRDMKKLIDEDFPDLQVVGAGEAQVIVDPQTGKRKMAKKKSQPYVIPGRGDNW
ncbi:MAG: hypothetical protein KGY81_07250 [Phycisphaerae bacterium]|jgi:hypothetical protein|nr:hypothetical protein [Phycisphaerae bacterium]